MNKDFQILNNQIYAKIIVDAHFWQKCPMVEEARQYEKCGEIKQQSKDQQAKMTGIMVHRPTKQ